MLFDVSDILSYYLIIWLVVIILSFYIEANTLDLISIWFTIGAIAALISGALGADFILQLTIFGLVSILLLLFTRPVAKKYLKINVVHTNADRVIGKIATITAKIESGERGEARVDGKLWTAIAEDSKVYEVGEKVEVLAIEGVKIIVRKIENE